MERGPKFSIGELVVWYDLIGKVFQIESYKQNGYTRYSYCLGNYAVWVEENQLQRCDWRDKIRILK